MYPYVSFIMGAICALHVPSIFSYLQSISEDPTGESSRNYHCAKTAKPNVVACLDENAKRQSSTTIQKKESAVSSEQSRKDSPSVSKTGAADVPLVWRSLESQGNPVQNLLQKWESFCCRRKINPLQATLQDGINFL